MVLKKCKLCDKKWNWVYDYEFYCDEHLPCGKFKRFMGTYIIPFLAEFLRYRTWN